MAEQPKWLKGEITGTCIGRPAPRRGGTGLARWYRLELVEASVGNWAQVAGPPNTAPASPAPFRQPRLEDVRLRAVLPGKSDESLSLQELSVWDWKMRDQREAGGESRCTLVGTVYAREVDGTRRPALTDQDDRLGPWGMLVALLGLLVAFWLWYSCGPFTCGLWSTVVVGSALSHRARTRRRSPPGIWSRILQSTLAAVLLLGGLGVALGVAYPAQAAVCGNDGALAVLLGFALVVAGSLLTIHWPLPWVWVVWTLVVVPWCGRSGTDCARQWVERAEEKVLGALPKGARPEGGAPGAVGAPPVLEKGSAARESGEGEAGSGTKGRGSGEGKGSGVGEGSGAGKENGSASGDGEGTGASEGKASGEGKGSGKGSGAGEGEGSSEGKGPGSGAGEGDGLGDGANEDGLDAAGEARMSIDTALGDPKRFLNGETRVTLQGDLLFSFDEDTLRPEADAALRQLAQLLRVNPNQRVLLEGHADTIGGEQYNQDLSERRARAVRAWLVQKAHINPLQLDVMGFGDSKPIVPASKGPAAQKLNRRVEVRVMSD